MKISFIIITTLIISQINAKMITFTNGTVHQYDGNIGTTNNNILFSYAQYYEENGIKFEFFGDYNSWTSIGNYYGVGNDVIHGHWRAVGGGMDYIKITKIDGSPFDMTYFKVTSNNNFGFNENPKVYINALKDGEIISYSQLVPPSNWGIEDDDPEVNLGAEFQNILAVTFTPGDTNPGFCFGLDQFFIDESAFVCFDQLNCQYCSGILEGQCSKCKCGNLLDGKCLESCPKNYYSENNECKPCDEEHCPQCQWKGSPEVPSEWCKVNCYYPTTNILAHPACLMSNAIYQRCFCLCKDDVEKEGTLCYEP